MKARRRWLVLVAAVAVSLPLAAPAAADAAYGAIAVNTKTGESGVGFGYSTKNAAQRRAERECPGRCRQIVWVRNLCGAVAQNPRNFIGASGPTKHKAIKRARKRAGESSRLVAWVCSG